VRHGNVSHVVNVGEVGSTLTCLMSSDVGDEQVASVQIV
jgi:hypothetical protein